MHVSFEVFPPKISCGVEHIYACLDGLCEMNPAFISVTYSAGEAQKGLTAEVCGAIRNRYGVRPVSHLTCAGTTKESLREELSLLRSFGVDTVLALRGDLMAGKTTSDFSFATDLMEAINEFGGFTLCGACYPEGHVESGSIYEGLTVLKKKYDLGVRCFISQLFFDNVDFLRMRDAASVACKEATFEAGIMPATAVGSLLRMVHLSGAKIPEKMRALVEKYADDKAGMKQVGIEYAAKQIEELKREGCEDIHFYTMDNVEITRAVLGGLQ